MLWFDKLLTDLNLNRILDITLFEEFVWVIKHVHWLSKLKTKSPPPPQMTCNSSASSFQEGVLDTNVNPSLLTGCFERSHPNWCVLTSSCHQLRTAGPHWTWLRVTEIALCSDFLLQTTEELQHTHTLVDQTKQCNVSVFPVHFS
jgi:hypothetical protein